MEDILSRNDYSSEPEQIILSNVAFIVITC